MTPLIDLAFLLIVFFILVARMGGEQVPPVALPSPHHAATSSAGSRPRLTVNVMTSGEGTILSLGAKRFPDDDGGRRALADAIAQRIRQDSTLPVDIRADRTLRYDKVEPALRAIAQAASQAGTGRVTIRVCALDEQTAKHE